MTSKGTLIEKNSYAPLQGTFELASVIFKSNIKLMIISTLFYLLLILLLKLVLVYTSSAILIYFTLFIIIFSIVGISFSGVVTMGKVLKSANNTEELSRLIKNTSFVDLHFKWLNVSMGHLVATILCIIPVIVFIVQFDNFIFTVISMALVLILLYVYPLIQERVIASKSFKESFSATFLLFKFSFIKRSLNVKYMLFVILYGISIKVISKLLDAPTAIIEKIYTNTSTIYMIVDAAFISVYIIFVSILIHASVTLIAKEMVDY